MEEAKATPSEKESSPYHFSPSVWDRAAKSMDDPNMMPTGSSNFSKIPEAIEAIELPLKGKKIWIKYTMDISDGNERFIVPVLPGVTQIEFGIVETTSPAMADPEDSSITRAAKIAAGVGRYDTEK